MHWRNPGWGDIPTTFFTHPHGDTPSMFSDQVKHLSKLIKYVSDADPAGVDEDLTDAFVSLRRAANALDRVAFRQAKGLPIGSTEV